MPSVAGLGLEAIDEVDYVEEAAAGTGSDAASGDGNSQVGGSWRSGGASTAELAALSAFANSPGLQMVETASVKEFGKPCKIPVGAAIHHGDDAHEGPLVRYTTAVKPMRQLA